MNERIKDLLDRCTTDTYRQMPEPWPLVDQEKFAELIVRECIDICNTTTSSGYLNGVAAGIEIRKHFGVEE